ncbi:MAG: helix-turn-helix transcriptional regulator [Planctomycetes bacterium]|nr:helix-turn-helix transcriptional regulator [Planctomycetota bacterium]
MQYAELSPPPDLALYVRRFWQVEDRAVDDAPRLERIVADGCMELVVHLGDRYARLDARGVAHDQARVLLAGQLEEPLLLRPGRTSAIAAIRFQPWGAAALLGIAPRELRGETPALEALLGAEAERLADALAYARDVEARFAILISWCRARLDASRRVPPVVVAAVQLAERSAGRVRVDELAARSACERRTLERAFDTWVGIAPKVLLRVQRMQRVLAALQTPQLTSLASLANHAGFADQAHFTREFRSLVGLAPSAYLRETHGLQDALLEG